MATKQAIQTVTVPASADLSTHQFKLGVINGSGKIALSGAGTRVDGVIGNKPSAADEATELQVGGIVKAIALGVIAPGAEIASNAAGLATTAVSTNYVFGISKALANTAANEIFPILVSKYNKV